MVNNGTLIIESYLSGRPYVTAILIEDFVH